MKKLSKKSVVCIICLGICAVWRVSWMIQTRLNAETKKALALIIALIAAVACYLLVHKIVYWLSKAYAKMLRGRKSFIGMLAKGLNELFFGSIGTWISLALAVVAFFIVYLWLAQSFGVLQLNI